MSQNQYREIPAAFVDLPEGDLESVSSGKASMGPVVVGTLATRLAGGIAFGRWQGPLERKPIAPTPTPGAHAPRGH